MRRRIAGCCCMISAASRSTRSSSPICASGTTRPRRISSLPAPNAVRIWGSAIGCCACARNSPYLKSMSAHYRGQCRGMLQHRAGDLALAHDYRIGAMLQQMVDLGVEMRPRDDVESRIGCARLLDDLAGLEGVRDRYQQQPRRAEVGGGEHALIGSITVQYGDCRGLQLLDHIGGVFDDQQPPPPFAQCRADYPADPAITDQHRMAAEIGARQWRFGGVRDRRGSWRRWAPPSRTDPARHGEHEGIHQDR